jgi:hypothetical protein
MAGLAAGCGVFNYRLKPVELAKQQKKAAALGLGSPATIIAHALDAAKLSILCHEKAQKKRLESRCPTQQLLEDSRRDLSDEEEDEDELGQQGELPELGGLVITSHSTKRGKQRQRQTAPMTPTSMEMDGEEDHLMPGHRAPVHCAPVRLAPVRRSPTHRTPQRQSHAVANDLSEDDDFLPVHRAPIYRTPRRQRREVAIDLSEDDEDEDEDLIVTPRRATRARQPEPMTPSSKGEGSSNQRRFARDDEDGEEIRYDEDEEDEEDSQDELMW